MSERIGVAVVGAGYWGPNLIRNMAESRHGELRVVCDLDRGRLAEVGRRYPGVKLEADFTRLLEDVSVQAVVLATPASSHHSLGLEAMRAGKDVLIEKPMTMTVRESRELIETAQSCGRVLMAGHTFVFNAAVKLVKSLVDKGEIGQVLYVYSSRVNLGQIRRDVNALWNVAPHDISIVNHVLGEHPYRARAVGRSFLQPGIEDVVFSIFEYRSGAVAHVHSSWLDPSKIRRTTFVGSHKMIVYDDVETEGKVKIYDKGVRRTTPHTEYGEFQLKLHSGDIHIPKITFTEPLAEECAHFLECVRTRKQPVTGGLDGLNVVAALEAAQQSLSKGGDAVEIETFESCREATA
jgi:predicted dehydrogenase